MRDCTDCPDEEKDEILRKRREDRRTDSKSNPKKFTAEWNLKRLDGNRNAKSVNYATENSISFPARHIGRINDLLCANIGLDVNLIDQRLPRRFEQNGEEFAFRKLAIPHSYSIVATFMKTGKQTKKKCQLSATMSVELHIGHDKMLVLRNLYWLVTVQNLTEPLLGRPAIE